MVVRIGRGCFRGEWHAALRRENPGLFYWGCRSLWLESRLAPTLFDIVFAAFWLRLSSWSSQPRCEARSCIDQGSSWNKVMEWAEEVTAEEGNNALCLAHAREFSIQFLKKLLQRFWRLKIVWGKEYWDRDRLPWFPVSRTEFEIVCYWRFRK